MWTKNVFFSKTKLERVINIFKEIYVSDVWFDKIKLRKLIKV